MSDADNLRRTLRDLLRLLAEAEHCSTCEGPSSSFDEACKRDHDRRWKEIRARAEKLLSVGARKPN
jgi:hypothetical protein